MILGYFIILLHSCKKKDNTEISKTNEVTTKATYKKGELVASEIYNKLGQLDNKGLYFEKRSYATVTYLWLSFFISVLYSVLFAQYFCHLI